MVKQVVGSTETRNAAQTLLAFRQRNTQTVFCVLAANGALVTWSTSRKAAYAEADKRGYSSDAPFYVQRLEA